MLPRLKFRLWDIHEEELYFLASTELARVLDQKNPTFLEMGLPSGNSPTTIRLGFPAPHNVRVYASEVMHDDNLVGLKTDPIYSDIPVIVDYRYGMELLPWMFDGLIWQHPRAQEITNRDNIANYVLQTSSGGFSGVIIRLHRGKGHDRSKEKLEIFSFSTGNEHKFFSTWMNDPNTKLLTRFLCRNLPKNQQIWRAEDAAPEIKV
jgi:hypothetical protein